MTRTWRAVLAALILVASPVAGVAQAPPDAASALEGLDEQIESWMDEWKVPGLGVSVVRDGRVVLARGYGVKDVESAAPATADTLFAIGSNTKSFTVTLLGMLAADGLFDWNTPVREYIPEFELHDEVATALMTPEDLVTHRSGLPRHDLLWLGTGLTRDELLARLKYLEPTQPLRYRYQYQNLMFMTAGILAERVTGASWEELTEQRIFAPLGMKTATVSVDDMQQAADFSYPHGHEGEGPPARIPFRNIDAVGPAGSVNASAREMANYVQFHLDYGRWQGEQLLPEATARSMQSPHMPITGPQLTAFFSGAEDGTLGDPSYGLGLMTGSYRGRKHVRHGGGIDGFISSMEWLPHDDIGVVVLSNTSSSGTVPGLVVRAVFDRLLGLEPIDWAGRSREAEAKARTAADEAREKRADRRHADTRPSHALEDFTGDYSHPAYGVAKVRLEADALQIEAVGFAAPLEHFHYDVFVVPDEIDGREPPIAGVTATFLYDTSGTVDRVTLPLQAGIDDIVFERLADAAMSELAFLEKLAGRYSLAGQVVSVGLRGETLTLDVPGQPTYTLVPKQGTTFGLKGLDGFSVEFDLAEGAEAASAATFHQPNGTFTAQRSED